MKHIIWSLLFAFALVSCGDFYTFNEEPDEWTGVTMKAANDSAFVMVGDSMPLRAEFAPYNPNESPVFWMTGDPYAVIRNDTLVAQSAGECSVVAIGGSGRLSDTCSVTVIDRWDNIDYCHSAPTDMVVYAKISVGGASWMPDSLPVAAVVRGKVAGVAVRKRFLDTDYALIRIWAQADAEDEPVTFVCYDRRKFRLYKAAQCPGYTATQALGTLSSLYALSF